MGDIGKFMNFVSEKQVEELRAARGDRVEDGTATVDRPLFEVLQEAKQKKDAEFNERFKNLPPKALDEDETEFLEAVDKHQKETEKAAAEEEFQALSEFKAAVAGQSFAVEDTKQPQKPDSQQSKVVLQKRKSAGPAFQVKFVPKKSKESSAKKSSPIRSTEGNSLRSGTEKLQNETIDVNVRANTLLGLASYDSDSEDK